MNPVFVISVHRTVFSEQKTDGKGIIAGNGKVVCRRTVTGRYHIYGIVQMKQLVEIRGQQRGITHGGHGICCPAGSLEQSDRELRPDVLVYRSKPLTEALTLLGRVTVELFASSSTADTDFTAVLTDIFPDGRVYNLCNGILRARYREGLDRQVPLPCNTPVRLRIDLWSIAAQIRPGHRIGLQISSSDFPQFARTSTEAETRRTNRAPSRHARPSGTMPRTPVRSSCPSPRSAGPHAPRPTCGRLSTGYRRAGDTPRARRVPPRA